MPGQISKEMAGQDSSESELLRQATARNVAEAVPLQQVVRLLVRDYPLDEIIGLSNETVDLILAKPCPELISPLALIELVWKGVETARQKRLDWQYTDPDILDLLEAKDNQLVGSKLDGFLKLAERAMGKLSAKQARQAHNIKNKLDNRVAYTIQPYVELSEMQSDPDRANLYAKVKILPGGLLEEVMTTLGRDMSTPVCLRVIPDLPMNTPGEREAAIAVQLDLWGRFRDLGYMPVDRLVFNTCPTDKPDSSWVKKALLAMFPRAIDLAAYGHRLGASILAGGYIPNTAVRWSKPMAYAPAKLVDCTIEQVKQALDSVDQTVLAVACKGFGQDFEACWGCWSTSTTEDKHKLALKWFGEDWLVRRANVWAEQDQEADGSGLYDPNHPDVANLVAKYGISVFQVTLMGPKGLFAKGIIVPRNGINDHLPEAEKCAFHFDLAQIKGSQKGTRVEAQVDNNVHLGIMRAWNKPAFYPGCFEVLQFIEVPKDPEASKVFHEALSSLVTEAMHKLLSKGVDGLLNQLADDEHLNVLIQIVKRLRATGEAINPMSVPEIRSALEDKLGKSLYKIAQGAGIRGKQLVTVLDSSVPRGSCVCPGHNVGEELAVWRFPCVLPQGLLVLKVQEPNPHHLIQKGEKEVVISNTIFMNPLDLGIGAQGDDDGDVVGVSNDPRVVKLFKMRVGATKQKLFAIEPEGIKMDTLSDSEDGLLYIQSDPRGPVGLTTVWQAKLAAIGDWFGVLALAVLNQEAIDSAKRRIVWSDPQKLLSPGNWEMNSKGVWRPKSNTKLSSAHQGEFPSRHYAKWVKARLASQGYGPDENLLPWRDHFAPPKPNGYEEMLSKRIHLLSWQPSWEKTVVSLNNTLNTCHDIAWRVGCEYKQEWTQLLGETKETDFVSLLLDLAEKNGHILSNQVQSWEEYSRGLRIEAGIEEYSRAMQQIVKSGLSGNEKVVAMEAARLGWMGDLALLSPNELFTCFEWEMTPTWKLVTEYTTKSGKTARRISYHGEQIGDAFQVNRPKYGFALLACEKMQLILGLTPEKSCDFLSNDKAQKLTNFVLRSPDPIRALVDFTQANTSHGDVVKTSNGERVEFGSCEVCAAKAADYLIREIRAKKQGTVDEMIKLVQALKKEPLWLCPNPAATEVQAERIDGEWVRVPR